MTYKNELEEFEEFEELEEIKDTTEEVTPEEVISVLLNQVDKESDEDKDSDDAGNQQDSRLVITFLSIDTEYNSTECLSLQGYIEYTFEGFTYEVKIMVINSKYEVKEVKEAALKYMSLNLDSRVYFSSLDDPSTSYLLGYFFIYFEEKQLLDVFFKKKYKVKIFTYLFVYYTLKDLNYCFGINNMLPYYLNKKQGIKQRRNISGQLLIEQGYKGTLFQFVFQIKDLCGLHPGGLKDLAKSVDLNKLDNLDEYKTNMDQALLERPFEFIEYAMNDAILLPTIFRKKIEVNNKVIHDLNINVLEDVFTWHNMPTTVGMTVFKTWNVLLNTCIFKNNKFFLLAYFKQGILNKFHPTYQENLEALKILSTLNSLKDLEVYANQNPLHIEKLYNMLSKQKVFLYKITQSASVDFLISEATTSSMSYLGLTTGGRTVNERPLEITIKHGADIDIQGAYGANLSKILYPVGRPRMYLSTPNDFENLTLGKFMKKHEGNLSDTLYKIAVSGQLTFNQDLIFSKIPPSSMHKYKIEYDKEEPDSAAVDAAFVLLRKEIVNGAITKPVWDILKQVCTKNELKEIYDLKVESAIYWLKSDQVFTIEEVVDEFLKDKELYEFDTKLNAIVDKRTHKWYGYPLKDFIDPLIEMRKVLKKLTDPTSRATQESIKLIINTFWGLLTSPYFDVNNVVCSEFVSSSTRCSVWLMSKALNTHISITDGGPYSLMNVSFLKKGKNPGLNILSSYYLYKNHRNIKTGSLANIDWEDSFNKNISYKKEPFINLDKYAMEHIKQFWSNYQIPITFNVEHKIEKTFIIASYIHKAHYMFKVWDDKTQTYEGKYFKIRGFKLDNSIPYLSPIYYLLEALFNNPKLEKFIIPNNGVYNQKKLIKLNYWRRNFLLNKKTLVYKEGHPIFPGDSILTNHEFRISNNYFYIYTLEEYKRKARRSFRIITYKENKNTVKMKMKLFEKYLQNHSILAMLDFMEKDLL